MWLMTRLAIIFYICILWLTSLVVVLFVLGIFDLETIQYLLSSIYRDTNLRIIIGAIACGFVIISVLLENLIYGRRRMERTIAFDNASGEVTVSLAAIEDLIKSLTSQLPEIKEIKPFLIADKKGIDAQIKLVLRAQVNIPDLTARLQDMVRRKIEETIGMEGRVNVRVHVAKMLLEDVKFKHNIEEPPIPFHGYRV